MTLAVETGVSDLKFDYEFLPVDQLIVHKVVDEESGKMVVDKIEVNGEAHQPSRRFFTSLFARFHFNKAFFKYFDEEEVFDRIAKRESRSQLRICIERSKNNDGQSQSRLLSVSDPAKPIVSYADLLEKLGSYRGNNVTYSDGIVESQHSPRVGVSDFLVGGDKLCNRFMVRCPIDGYGLPSTYLCLLRQVCRNGIIAMSKAFRQTIALGQGDDNISFALVRVLDQFNNEEGFAALRQRLEAATRSWCSVYETQTLYKLLVGCHHYGEILGSDGAALKASPAVRKALLNYNNQRDNTSDDTTLGGRVMTAFHGLTGDATQYYGLANLDALSAKRQRTLPVNCTVYDAINFATELATHYALPSGARKLNGWIGSLVTNEYDMEGTKDRFGDFKDFHINAKLASGLTGSDRAGNN